MHNNKYLISISIPSYNRPEELKRLLNSIDSKYPARIQIVICEDKSPLREEVRKIVEEYKRSTIYDLKYIENPQNYGFDKSIRTLIERADGEYILYMGDDDMFIPNALDKFIYFVKNHTECGYFLRSYRNVYKNGSIEYFRYYSDNKFFEPSEKTYAELFLKSVFMSGFTIKTEYVKNITTDIFDSTLLFQLYLVGEVCLNYPSAYFNIPFTQGIQGDTIPLFGNSEIEKGLYTPGRTQQNDINFYKSFFKITKYIDKKYSINSTEVIRKEISKYSFPLMARWRSCGIKEFKEYCHELRRMELDCTIYFDVYYFGLLLFGKKFCQGLIRIIKRILGRRPNL